MGCSLLCQGAKWERHSGRRTRRQGHTWQSIMRLRRLGRQWLPWPRRGQGPVREAARGQVTAMAATEGELYPLAWRSRALRCHWEGFALCQMRALKITITI